MDPAGCQCPAKVSGPRHHGQRLHAPQMRAALGLLRKRYPHGPTSLELAEAASVLDPRGIVYELRRKGVEILTSYAYRTPKGRKVYRFTLATLDEPIAVGPAS